MLHRVQVIRSPLHVDSGSNDSSATSSKAYNSLKFRVCPYELDPGTTNNDQYVMRQFLLRPCHQMGRHECEFKSRRKYTNTHKTHGFASCEQLYTFSDPKA